MESYNIYKASEIIKIEDYIDNIDLLIKKARSKDKTVIPHSKKELEFRYENSLICISKKEIIANLSLYPTQIREILDYNIGEIGTVIVDNNFRGQGLGKKIVKKGIDVFGEKYKGIISATINKSMYKILHKNNFKEIGFFESYYNEGKEFLAPLLEGGEKEFKNKAKSFLLCNDFEIKKKILELLKKQSY